MNQAHAQEMKTLVLVLGPGRTGSSITTKLLMQLGCELGNELLGASENSNPLGHFENMKVLRFHEKLLSSASTNWNDPSLMTDNNFIRQHRFKIEEEIKELLNELVFIDNITALKEPRISILIDLWEPILNEFDGSVKVVLTIRHPSEVAMSLLRRDGLDVTLGLHYWIRAMLNGIRYARNVPNLFLFYTQLVDFPDIVANELEKFIGIASAKRNHLSIDVSDIKHDYGHFSFNNEMKGPSKLASEIFTYVSRQDQASFENFPNSLLDDWEARLQINLVDIDREALISLNTQQRDELTQQRDELVNSTIWKTTKPIRRFLSLLKR